MQPKRIRPLQRADIPEISRLFFHRFRKRPPRSFAPFEAYLQELLFSSPSYTQEHGGMVHEARDGSIDAAVTTIPIDYWVGDRKIIARLLCTFMSAAGADHRGAAELSLAFRARNQDFCFSDSASPVSSDHVCAMGGVLLDPHGLEWCKVFKPAGFSAEIVASKLTGHAISNLKFITGPADTLIRRFRTPADSCKDELHVKAVTVEAFSMISSVLLGAYVVRPVWSADELNWIRRLASSVEQGVEIEFRIVCGKGGDVRGAFVFSGRPDTTANVLNILSDKGRELGVVDCIMGYLEDRGHPAARGRVNIRLMKALSRQRSLMFQHRADVCVLTREAVILDAIRQDQLYLGGLAGEAWSRLTWDFK